MLFDKGFTRDKDNAGSPAEGVVESRTNEATDWEARRQKWAAWKKENPNYVPKGSEYTKANLKKKAQKQASDKIQAKSDKCDASCNCNPRGDEHKGEQPNDCPCDKCFLGSGQCSCGHKTCKG